MYEWDEGKRQANLAKHGVDFADMDAFEWDTAVIDVEDRRGSPLRGRRSRRTALDRR